MLSLQPLCFIIFIANRVRKRSRGAFSASIYIMVTVSIAIGVASILIASMVLLGFQEAITKKITSFSGHFEITKYSGNPHPYEPVALQAAQIAGLMANVPKSIEKIEAFAQKFMIIRTKSGIEGILCKGLDPMTSHKALEDYLIVGRLPNLIDAGYQNELLISHHLAQKLSIKLGDRVVVHTMYPTTHYRKVKIVGIYRTYLNNIDTNLTFCDIRFIQRLNNWTSETVSGYEVFLKDGVAITKALRDSILRLIDYDLRLIRTSHKYASFYDWISIIQRNTTVFIFFILLIAGFTMVAIVMIQLIERSYMVGLLKALGAHAWQVHTIILYNSLQTLFGGMVYGNMLGLGLCFLQDRYKCATLEAKLYYMTYVPICWSWKSILFTNLFVFGTICVTLYCTIKLLAHKKITEALQEG